MMNHSHQEILALIKNKSGSPTQHTFLDSYLGNTHPRYPINAPTLRAIAKEWMKAHREITAKEFSEMLTSLIEGKSSTEKMIAGIMMDYATKEQRKFNPAIFDSWLDHLIGWAEVDVVCTGKYTVYQLIEDWQRWKPLLEKFNRSKNIHKRRASLVLLCSPVRHSNNSDMAEVALKNIEHLKLEKEILITKAISWLLRSMIKHHKKMAAQYIMENAETLPAIAVRETSIKLTTGTKTKRKI